jgi:hypothetical protein
MPSPTPLHFALLKSKQAKESGNRNNLTMASTDEKSAYVTESPAPAKQENERRRAGMATIEDDDERLLAQIGYTQVRDISKLSSNVYLLI